MAKSIQLAEAELRTAALGFAEADAEYSRQYMANKEYERYEKCRKLSVEHVLLPETLAAVRAANAKRDLLGIAAIALCAAINAEQRAEAL